MAKEYGNGNTSSFRKDIEELDEIVSFAASITSKAQKIIQKFENQKTPDYKDINNKLSDYAQYCLQEVKGPIKGDNLLKLLMDDVLGKQHKEMLTIIRRYSNDIDGVREQLLKVLEKVEEYVKFRKKQTKLDDSFMKEIKKLNKTIDEEHAKERQSNTIQTTVKQYFPAEKTNFSQTSDSEVSDRNSRKLNRRDPSASSNNPAFKKQEEKCNRKRKSENSSKKKNGVRHITSQINKRLQMNLRENTKESCHYRQPVSAVESDGSDSQHTEPMSIDSTSSQHTEPMSVSSEQSSSSQHTESMSVDSIPPNSPHTETTPNVSSEESNSQPDETSVDDPRENRNSKSSRLGEDASENSENEKTVSERRFRLRGQHLFEASLISTRKNNRRNF